MDQPRNFEIAYFDIPVLLISLECAYFDLFLFYIERLKIANRERLIQMLSTVRK